MRGRPVEKIGTVPRLPLFFVAPARCPRPAWAWVGTPWHFGGRRQRAQHPSRPGRPLDVPPAEAAPRPGLHGRNTWESTRPGAGGGARPRLPVGGARPGPRRMHPLRTQPGTTCASPPHTGRRQRGSRLGGARPLGQKSPATELHEWRRGGVASPSLGGAGEGRRLAAGTAGRLLLWQAAAFPAGGHFRPAPPRHAAHPLFAGSVVQTAGATALCMHRSAAPNLKHCTCTYV